MNAAWFAQHPEAALAAALHGLTLLVQHGLAVDLRRYAGGLDLRVVRRCAR